MSESHVGIPLTNESGWEPAEFSPVHSPDEGSSGQHVENRYENQTPSSVCTGWPYTCSNPKGANDTGPVLDGDKMSPPGFDLLDLMGKVHIEPSSNPNPNPDAAPWRMLHKTKANPDHNRNPVVNTYVTPEP